MAKQNNKTSTERSLSMSAGYKSSPLGIIPKDWNIEELSNVFEYINTPSFSRDNLTGEKTNDELYYIHYGDIHATYKTELLDFDIETRVPFLKDEFYSENFNFLKEGDLVIADASEDYEGVGECIEIKNIRNKKIIGGLHTIVIRDNSKKTCAGFRTYIFRNKNIHNELKKIATGTSVYGISKGNLSKIKLPLPPLPEQKAIANLLSKWDKAIQNTTQLIAQKEQRKKWLMQQLLTGRKKLKGFEKEKWKSIKIKEVFNEIKDTNDGMENHTVMTISAKRGLISQEDKFDRVIAGDSLKKYTLLKKNDFAYNKGNSKTYPMGCIYQLENVNSALVPFVYICFSPTDKVSPIFYKHWFLAHGLDRQLKTIISSGARGDGLLNVNTDDFFNLKIPYPSIQEQKEIGKIMESSDKEIKLLQDKLNYFKEQKKGLMQVLLTGKKRLKLEK
jgi:type I restriction enzyme S subunit